ncbi:MAG TPA: hypothetical protein VIY29_15520 [Ktedonobacteraceae bacterium]
MDYETIKQLAKEMSCKVTDLIPLAPQNDPFYTGTPSDWMLGEWFARLWQAFGYQDKVHIRRVHYQIVSQRSPVLLPNGKPYENTAECWDTLNMASKAARYLQLVDPAAFSDRRNDDPVLYAPSSVSTPQIQVYGNLWRSSLELPNFPNPPEYGTSGFQGMQRYHIEVGCEKSTMNDVLLPLCERYQANLQTGSGELSITATLALAHRLAYANKPARIFYVSDFDPAGQSMPVAVSRKLEYFIRRYELDLDVRVYPVVLTLDQVQYYGLPRTPIKETERRRQEFELRHGEGAVELDALEALYPGELQAVLARSIEEYYDTSLDEQVAAVEQELQERLSTLREQVVDGFASEIDGLREEYTQLRDEFTARAEGCRTRIVEVWQAMKQELVLSAPRLAGNTLPQAAQASEIGEGLYDSTRDYIQQIEAYKEFQGRV